MKRLWVDLRAVPRRARISHLRAAQEAGADLLLDEGDEASGAVVIQARKDGSLWQAGKRIGAIHAITDRATALAAAKAPGILVAELPDWRVIPLETLIAARRRRPGTLFAQARDLAEVRLFATVLDRGVHGILFTPDRPGDILEARQALQMLEPKPAKPDAAGQLESAQITGVESGGVADRVCLDATTRFEEGEGIPVGATAASLALVLAETATNPHIPARPFRVNAGAIHQYGLDGERTPYLSEATAGKSFTAVNGTGTFRSITIGRAKVERRPHLLLRWRSPSGPGHAFLQEAETVRLLSPGGTPRQVTALRVGDSILVWCQAGSRHTGEIVDAEVVER